MQKRDWILTFIALGAMIFSTLFNIVREDHYIAYFQCFMIGIGVGSILTAYKLHKDYP